MSVVTFLCTLLYDRFIPCIECTDVKRSRP